MIAWTLLAYSEAAALLNDEQRQMLSHRLEKQQANESVSEAREAYFEALRQLLEHP